MGPFRVQRIPDGEKVDQDGRQFAEDWPVIDLGKDEDGASIFVTTDHVRASEYGSVVPGTQRGIATLIVESLNERFEELGPGRWVDVIAECDAKIEHNPPKPPEPTEWSGTALNRVARRRKE